MSKNWNNCIEIYKDGDFVDNIDVDRSMFMAWQKYVNVIRQEPYLNVWYDTKTGSCFGPEQDFYKNPEDFSFFSQRDGFKDNPFWGTKHVAEKFGDFLGNNTIVEDEYILQDLDSLKKYKNSTILVVAAGPSTIDVDWENTEYDYIWSCTKFFMNDKLKNLDIDLVTVGGNVDLDDDDFNEYLSNHNTLCGFECGVSPFKKPEDMVEFKYRYPNRIFYYHPRYFSKLGAGARLLCLGSFLGAKEIKFVGFDGNPVDRSHSFEGVDKVHGESWRNSSTNDLYRRQTVLLWDYLLQFDTKFQNLGEGHPANQNTNISRQEFPLSEK